MKIVWTQNAWEDYLYWQKNDKKMVKRINDLIKEIKSNPYCGIGKPEPLKFDLVGKWSRRIDLEHRFIYEVKGAQLIIYAVRYHY